MLDYKSIVRLKRLGLNNSAIASKIHCKWDSVQRIVARCESVWGSVDGVPENLSNEEIADILFSSRKSVDLDYLQPDSEKILEKQRQGHQRNELWAEYCAEAAALGKKAYKLSRFNEIVSEYDLLCIDEFPNYDIEDKFLMQEFFNQTKMAGHSTIVCGQCSPENWDSLFEVKSFAQSIRGRLLEHAYRLELKGPDLRTYNPDKS